MQGTHPVHCVDMCRPSDGCGFAVTHELLQQPARMFVVVDAADAGEEEEQ